MGLYWQVVSTAIASYLSMSMGIMFTWPSSTLLLFSSENTTLSRPMTINEQSLLGSLSFFGSLISTPVSGWMLDSIGRKYSCIVLSMTHVIAWAMIALSDRVEVILASTFVAGIGGAFFVVVPIFISEFCQQSIRGAMTSGATVFYTLGMLISYWFGGTLSYYVMVYTCFCISLVGVLLLGLMRESPVYLMQKGTEEQARNAIAFFRSLKPYDKEVVEEINAIRRALTPDLMDATPVTDDDEKMVPFEMKPAAEKLSTLQFLKKSKSTRRAFAVTIILVTACLFQGLIVLMVFAEPLFKMAVPSMSSMVCSIIMAALCLVAGIAAAYLCDVVGRKSVMIYSSLASGVCCVVLGTQIHLQWSPPILTVLMIFLFCVVYTLGPGTIPYVISSEVFLPEIRGFCSMMVMEWFNVCAFLIIYIFNPLVEAIGLGPFFYFFGAVCFGTAVFTSAHLPETKGLAVDEIQLLFAPKSLKKGTVCNDEHIKLNDKC